MADTKNILVTGANGQLGMEFRLLEKSFPQYQFFFVGKEDLNICNPAEVSALFDNNEIAVCINCAAYTLVDKAEAEKDLAYAVNATAVATVAKECTRAGALLFHISTDYVFAGNGIVPYKETDPTHPINIYAASKLAGEEFVREYCKEAIIIRTSWVYSQYGNNFVKTMRRLMSEKKELGIVADQLGCPTYAADLAAAVMHIISIPLPPPGTYHYCNQGVISWYDFALAIKQITHSACKLHPIVTSAYPTPALRPHYSALDTSAFRQTFGIEIPKWKESLEICLAAL